MEKILQITAGRGPVECCWVVAQVFKYLVEDAKKQQLSINTIHKVNGDANGTLVSVIFQLEGNNRKLNKFLKSWVGTIQWIGKSDFRKFHKRKNWFIGIEELDLSSQTLKIDEQHFKFEATRSGGPGGQHVNKVSTAVRATHIPSGLSVLASDSRSQLKNRKNAKERLVQLLKTEQLRSQKEKAQTGWQQHNQLKRGSPVKVFKGSDFKSEKVDKTYKTQRKQLKQNLRNLDFED